MVCCLRPELPNGRPVVAGSGVSASHHNAGPVSSVALEVSKCAQRVPVENPVDSAVDKTVNNVMLRLWEVHDRSGSAGGFASISAGLILLVDISRPNVGLSKCRETDAIHSDAEQERRGERPVR